MSDDERLPPRPAWRTDFPVERAEAQHVNRREFAKYLVLVSGGFAAGSGMIAIKDDLVAQPELPEGGARLCGIDELPVGASLPFVVPGTNVPAFVVRLDEATYRAYETKCTHLSCAVFYAPESGRIECPCHNGAFDARSGAVLQGPPPRGLRRFAVEVRGGDLVLTGEERS
ncbi:MAG: Rieske (2Fe-2S) protein [Thermoanaerobaculia bacterium]|nr:Rieske (2Fe-2S) protein [Thermoanaerobaculia bacterium]